MSSLVRATAVMSLGTVLSRFTGLLRLIAMTAALGIVESRRLTDTYNLANTAPNIIYELILGGVLTSVFIPVFVELLEKEGRERAWRIASAILNVSLVVLVAVATLGVIAAPLIARFYAFRLEGEAAALQQDVLAFLLRLLIPQIVFYGLAAIVGGLLNAHRRFGPPMYTPILNNLAVIAVFTAFYQAYGKIGGLEDVTTTQLLVIGLGTTAGVVLMAIAQLPFLRGLGRYRPSFAIRHPSVRKLARLAVFVIGYVVVNQIGYLVVQWLANRQVGGYTAYVAAFTFFLLPHGLFAVSIFTALLPGMSGHAVNERWTEFRDRLSTGVRATMLLILPAAVGYLALATPIVRILQNGVVSTSSVQLVTGVLQFFVLGLVPFSLFQLFLRAFYALQDTRTPFLINCAAVALNTAINVPMFIALGVRGLAAGHAIAYTFGAAAQGVYLRRRIGGLDGARVVRSGVRIAGAAAAMGVVAWGVSLAIEAALDPSTLLDRLVALAVPVGAGAASYVAFAHVFGVEELTFVRRLLLRRSTRGGDS